MTGAVSATLSAPLHQIRSLIGSGDTALFAHKLTTLQLTLSDSARATARTSDELLGAWRGAAAASADASLSSIAEGVRRLDVRLSVMVTEVAAAADAVTRVRAELDRLIADFEAQSAALEAQLDTPGVAEELTEEARRALATARDLVEDLRTELSQRGENVIHTSETGSLPTPPSGGWSGTSEGPGAGLTGSPNPGMSTSSPAMFGGLGSGVASKLTSGLGSQLAEAAFAHRSEAVPDAAQFGAGEAVTLPDGTTASAPNAVAASAVRHALTQLGVPYQWGGTTAGVGLDCSGLTQWAYHEAGLNIPRLAQEQDIGSMVAANALRPGDLAVWDGHVAMVVGGGLMIEAGDPVQLSDIRTTNAGQGFQGFWRPTT